MSDPVSDFDPEEFSDRYEFRKGLVYSRRNSGRPLTPQMQTNPKGRDYSYYQLTDNGGTRRKISTLLISGKVSKEGDIYQITHWPKGWQARAGFPSYLFHPEKRLVRRVGFLSPRACPVDVQPNKCGQYRLHTPDGYKWYHRDDLFI